MKVAGGLLILAAASASAQDDGLRDVILLTLPEQVRQPADFVPAGWKLVASKTGDLNADGRPDVAVLMRMTDPANIEDVSSTSRYYKQDDTNPYLLAIGFARPGGFSLVTTNSNLFPRLTAPMHEDTPPGPDAVAIARGVLALSFEHLRSSDTYRFRWDGSRFALVGYDCAAASGAGGNFYGLSANYLTRIAKVERGKISDDRRHWRTVRIKPGKRPALDQAEWEFGWTGTDINGNDLGC